MVTARLRINDATVQDTRDYFYLEATNQYGRQEYRFEVTEKRPPSTARPPYDPDEEGGSKGSNVGAIVGAVVGTILILCAVIIVLVFLYKQKKLCFVDKSAADGKAGSTYINVEQRENVGVNPVVAAANAGNDMMDDGDGRSNPIIRSKKNKKPKTASSDVNDSEETQNFVNQSRRAQSYLSATRGSSSAV